MSAVAPKTYLQLVQSLQVQSGTSGSPISTLLNATGETQRMAQWVSEAYIELQQERQDWLWMTQDVQFDTITNQQSYSPVTTTFTTPAGVGIADFARWVINPTGEESTFRLYLKSAGVVNETWLSESDYRTFRDFYIFGFRRLTAARPITICVDPQQNLLLGLMPNDIYTVVGKYVQSPQQLLLDADTPNMPARFHNLIVYRALEKYGLYESAPEVIAYARDMAWPIMIELQSDQLPPIIMPDPME